MIMMQHVHPQAKPWLKVSAECIEIANELHKVVFLQSCTSHSLAQTGIAADSTTQGLGLYTFIRNHDRWEPLFDGGGPLLSGPNFDLYPRSHTVVENNTTRVAVMLYGQHERLGYKWDALVEAMSGNPLIHVTVTCHLTSPLSINTPQPSAVLWMNRPSVDAAVNQGPGNIYTGADVNGWANGFPAAYIWIDGKEAAFFAQMSQLTWMGKNRFNRAYRVQSAQRDGRSGLGLWALEITSNPVPSGDRVMAEYYLYAASRPEKPTRLQALDRMVDVFGGCHPAHSSLPVNHKGGPTNWTYFAKKMISNLMVKDTGGNPGAVWDDVEVAPPWDDGLTTPVSVIRISPDYALKSGAYPALFRKRATDLYDFSTCNNYVAPWAAIERLDSDPAQREFLRRKATGYPLFYDPKARMIRYGIRQFNKIGEFEMPWQHYTFAIETLKLHDILAPEDFNPAVAGHFLMAIPAEIELAHNVNYVFSQWFDPYSKQNVIQQDVKELGIVYEPWQNGSYAWLMAKAYEMTGDTTFLEEAKRSLDTLLSGNMTYSVKNTHYEITYTDPVDFPITEIFGNSYGIAAGQKIYELTGDGKFLHYSRDFLNSLLRATFWYESALETDPKDKILKNAGLFQAYVSYLGAAPWETIEAYLPMTVMLRGDNPRAPIQLLMRLFNTMRLNSFWFFPPVFHGETITSKELVDNPADYISIENFCMPERGGDHGGMGRAIYMSQISLWNYLLFEAMAECNDPDIMVLNLDLLEGFQEAASSAERNFYAFNPTANPKTADILFKKLIEGKYDVTIMGADGQASARTMDRRQMEAGIRLTLGPCEYQRIKIGHTDAQSIKDRIRKMRAAQNKLSVAYKLWCERQRDHASDPRLDDLKRHFKESMALYQDSDYAAAALKAQGIINEISRQSD